MCRDFPGPIVFIDAIRMTLQHILAPFPLNMKQKGVGVTADGDRIAHTVITPLYHQVSSPSLHLLHSSLRLQTASHTSFLYVRCELFESEICQNRAKMLPQFTTQASCTAQESVYILTRL